MRCCSLADRACPAPIFGDAALEEVLLFSKIDRLTHPGEGITGLVLAGHSDSFESMIGNVLDIITKEIGIQAENPKGRQSRA